VEPLLFLRDLGLFAKDFDTQNITVDDIGVRKKRFDQVFGGALKQLNLRDI
jgi:hypothetical protein